MKVTAIALVLMLLGGCCQSAFDSCERAFDSNAWQLADAASEEGRYKLIPALTRDHLIVGRGREALRSLLGKPDESEAAPRWWTARGRYDAYVVRFYYNIIDYDTEYLLLIYDEKDMLHSWAIATIPG